MAHKRIITREEAEQLIAQFQMELLREYDCLSTWEMYADFGAGPCCGGIFRLRTAELREIYRGLIPGVDGMDREELIKAILRYERAELGGRLITCQAVADKGRVCDGLSRYTNQELPWHFPEVLGGCEVVDDPLNLGEAARYLGVRLDALLRLVQAGAIPVHRVGASKKVYKASLDQYRQRGAALIGP